MYSVTTVSESSIAIRVWNTRHSQVPTWQVFSLDIISDNVVANSVFVWDMRGYQGCTESSVIMAGWKLKLQ